MPDEKQLARFGFRFERGGTHSSRTMMLDELTALLDYVNRADATKADYLNAIEDYNKINNPLSDAKTLQCLFKLNDYAAFNRKVSKLVSASSSNIYAAAIIAFVSHQLKQEDPYPFCNNPLDFISITNLSKYKTNVGQFISEIIGGAQEQPLIWEPGGKTTEGGFQSEDYILGDECKFVTLEQILLEGIEAYYQKFKDETCDFIKLWPTSYSLKGWFVRLIKNGHQRSHIHPAGWLSGVVYLKVVKPSLGNEGAIEFSLHGYDLPILDKTYPTRIHQPNIGDIVLFPSSLFHRTIPFTTDEERCVIAFDLIPGA